MRERSREPQITRETVRETREIPIPIVVDPPEMERVYVSEERERRPSHSRVRAVEEDEVVVIEEHDPPRRKKRRSRERETRDSGQYRVVDPAAYAGGEREPREVRRSRRMSGGRGR